MPINVRTAPQTFGEWLQQLLDAHKTKPIKFAELCKISRSTISRYLSGDRIPNAQKQDMIIEGLCSISDMERAEVEQKVLWHCHISQRRRQV
jgi:transcriptional regulator with XRE-family HTH domain